MPERNAGPRLYLAVDNCFASKRWTRPAEWMALLADMGIGYVEASADNECDPLYMGREYLARWVQEVREAEARTGVRVANMYSGHGSYATLGLAHSEPSVRERMQEEWIKPMCNIAAKLDAGIGFYCHAFANAVLQQPEVYAASEEDLYARLADIAAYCRYIGVATPGVEQMYTPHQVPWTIAGAERLLREVYARSGGAPFYLTLDTGHQSGQRRFKRPTRAHLLQVAAGLAADQDGAEGQGASWLGPESIQPLLERLAAAPDSERPGLADQIERELDRYSYLFAGEQDGDTYAWLRQLGSYSPIIHLQQTDGSRSAHLPFDETANRNGIIFGPQVLAALQEAYRVPAEAGMPPRSEHIYLTLEVFSGTAELNNTILRKVSDSVAYWRQYIPYDGITLEEALGHEG
ncbi:TIM barrel protein [Paenibacillus sp. 598K]|uniref:TIM barrel protein n=1 Tax=Paenibacillus sp. 598K TaxID=1117987 RepID=UPI000FFF0385|nr:TIM barrel protein [Paenibacillus sp. 598K]